MTNVRAMLWAMAPAGLLGAMVAGLVVMAVIASNDPGFALERDYYAKAVSYDQEIAQREQNQKLGWRVEAKSGAIDATGRAALVVRVTDGAGPIAGARVQVEALRNASASRVVEASLIEARPGEYRAELDLRRGGLWEFRLEILRSGERFTEVSRLDVSEAQP